MNRSARAEAQAFVSGLSAALPFLMIVVPMGIYNFIETMNNDYAKAIGRSCNFCHERRDFASDERKEKATTRIMIAMEDSINNSPAYLPQLRNRRGTWPHIECVTCHRGMNEPNHALLPP